MIWFNSYDAMVQELATGNESDMGIEVVSNETGEVEFWTIKGKELSHAFEELPTSKYDLTFHGRTWARQIKTEKLQIKLNDLKRIAAESGDIADEMIYKGTLNHFTFQINKWIPTEKRAETKIRFKLDSGESVVSLVK